MNKDRGNKQGQNPNQPRDKNSDLNRDNLNRDNDRNKAGIDKSHLKDKDKNKDSDRR